MKLKKLSILAFASFSLLSLASCNVDNGGTSTTNSTKNEGGTQVVTPSATTAPTSTPSSNPTSTPTSAPSSNPTTTPTSTPSSSATSSSTKTEAPTNPTDAPDDPVLPTGSGKVETETTVKFTSILGEYESAYAEFKSVEDATGYNFYLTGGKYKSTTLVDSSIVYYRLVNGVVRADFIGLEAGDYTLEVKPIINNIEDKNTGSTAKFTVVAYDRSGYAHFKYNEGVGAYNSDGTLKNNAIVLYVTDENKNTVTLTYGGKTVSGIGNILNSVGQATTEAGHEGQCKKVDQGKSYYAKANTNQGIIKDLADANIPLVVRFVGCVSDSGLYKQDSFDASKASLIEGLTAYAKSGVTVNADGTNPSNNAKLADYGGTLGDNGHMARIKSAKNLTLEGIGDDAIIDGWGFHLICEAASPNLAKNFEVRNLTFMNTPEDAIGMEGQQENSSKTITASVERCWIHHNTFLAPSIQNPAESDKSEGDGSCDFKRGQYFTCSYNYFEGCHKTNLIGSSDTSLQYNLSYHHNIWYNCGSRIPLLRQANIHFYNNYILGGDNASYVSDIRANGYLFAEANYYQGAKNVIDSVGSGCAVKMYNNELLATYSKFDINSVITNDRESKVTCSTAYKNISYQNFDTNPELFYYDSVNKRSDCYLTSATVARNVCLAQSGSKYRTNAKKTQITSDYQISKVTDLDSIDLSTPFTMEWPNNKNDGNVGGIYYTNISGRTSSSVKFKGPGMTFKLSTAALLEISMTSSSGGYADGYVIDNITGEIMLTGSGTCILKPGIYTVVSSIYIEGTGKNSKETTVLGFSLTKYNSEELNQALLNNYNNAAKKLPETITYTEDVLALIKSAITAYDSLPIEIKNQGEIPYSVVQEKYNQYLSLGKAYVEGLISDIGTVTNESGLKINLARTEYDTLKGLDSSVVISNYDVLVQAEETFKTYAVDSCIKAINAIGDVTLDSKSLIEIARNAYNQLDDEDKALVTNYDTLVAKEEAYNNLVIVSKVINLIDQGANTLEGYNTIYTEYNKLSDTLKSQVTNKAKYDELMINYTNLLISSLPEASNITTSNQEAVNKAKELYNSLPDKTGVTNYQKLTDCDAKLNELLSQRQVLTFNTGASGDNPFFTITAGSIKDKIASKTYNGVTYTSALKIESKTSISFTTTTECKVTLVLSKVGEIKIDGNTYTANADGIVEITLASGTHTIIKGEILECYAIIVE